MCAIGPIATITRNLKVKFLILLITARLITTLNLTYTCILFLKKRNLMLITEIFTKKNVIIVCHKKMSDSTNKKFVIFCCRILGNKENHFKSFSLQLKKKENNPKTS